MSSHRIEALIEAAKSCGIVVERVPLGGEGGGLAVVAGQRKLYVDTMADAATAYDTTLSALADVAELDVNRLPDSVREDMVAARSK